MGWGAASQVQGDPGTRGLHLLAEEVRHILAAGHAQGVENRVHGARRIGHAGSDLVAG